MRKNDWYVVCYREPHYPAFRIRKPTEGGIESTLRNNLVLPPSSPVTLADLRVYGTEGYGRDALILPVLDREDIASLSECRAALHAAKAAKTYSDTFRDNLTASLAD